MKELKIFTTESYTNKGIVVGVGNKSLLIHGDRYRGYKRPSLSCFSMNLWNAKSLSIEGI